MLIVSGAMPIFVIKNEVYQSIHLIKYNYVNNGFIQRCGEVY